MASDLPPPLHRIAQRLVNFVHNPSKRPFLLVIALVGNWIVDDRYRKAVENDIESQWQQKWYRILDRDVEATERWLEDTVRADIIKDGGNS